MPRTPRRWAVLSESRLAVTAINANATLTFSPPHPQWFVEEKDGGWTLRNVATSLHLGINGDSRDGAPAVMVAESFPCHIKPDDEDPSTYRCAAATPDI